ncbi:MAG: squalene synthase HpnC [Gallionella sp.]|jgi:phytoene synthase|nr:squalene synthase HpnC [Gallionella sp.]
MPVDHYENFPVASILMPRRLRKPVAAIYHFAREADDIADEGEASNEERLSKLEEFRAELARIAAQATPLTPLFQNLAAEIAQHELPMQPFYDLLDAFAQDVVQKRYADYDELLDYCRRSANPVGTLLLHLYEEATLVNLAYSDAICTALQLINFWQDVAKDDAIARIYLPLDEMEKFGVGENHITQKICDDAWRALMSFQVDRARSLMLQGAPLGSILTGRIGLEMRMIIQGGLRILAKIEAVDYDVFNKRPVLRPFDWVIMFSRSVPFNF